MKCPECHVVIPDGSKFCNECGAQLSDITAKPPKSMPGERKHATIMFSDLSGYTSMSEKLDPEEVKALMGRIFSEASRIVEKYKGTVERFFGDEVMALFGAPIAHEDDPVRAVKAAKEIHAFVNVISPEYESKIDRKLSMHTGINSGLVVTGEKQLGKDRHGLTGGTINTAKRLTSLASADEILIGTETFQQVQFFYKSEKLKPILVKGKADPAPVYKVLSALDQQQVTECLFGVQAEFIGRETEMAILTDAVEELKNGQGAIISIVGQAGTGKSRLIREFKVKLNTKGLQWREGHAYAYTQNIAFYPLTNLLTHAFQIREGDNSEQIRAKVAAGVKELIWDKPDIQKYLGGLFSLDFGEDERVSPEFWRHQLYRSAQQILEALASRGPTVVLFEDLHWADRSFIELLQLLLTKTRRPVLFICVYRPSFNLFEENDPNDLAQPYYEIKLQELSSEQTQSMLQSLLNSSDVPEKLHDFIQEKVEGNPFYLEEVINSLIETGTLNCDNGGWQLTQEIKLADIPTTIQGVLNARLDRLKKEAKRILQEASVIGRAFFYEVLTRVTELTTPVEGHLAGLESLDLIRARTREPDLEYIFKHAITQEVVYNGLLKKERRDIHERIGQAMENLFGDRMPEFYEAIAFHYSRGRSIGKAIGYLIKAGEKNLSRYAVHEAYGYFENAFELLATKTDRSRAENIIIADVLNNWAFANYYMGNMKETIELFTKYEDLVKTLEDSSRYGMFCAWFGIAYYMAGMAMSAYDYLTRAVSLGEQGKDQKVIGYACSWLTWTCADIGQPNEGIDFGRRAVQISKSFLEDQYLYFKPRAGIGVCHYSLGNVEKIMEIGRDLKAYGEKTANSRCMVMAHYIDNLGKFASGDLDGAIESGKKSEAAAKDPHYKHMPLMAMGPAYLLKGQIQEALETFGRAIPFFNTNGIHVQGTLAEIFYGVALIAGGKMSEGMEKIIKARESAIKNKRRLIIVYADYAMGKVYSEIACGEKPSIGVMLKNAAFLMKHLPFATKRAISYFQKAISWAEKLKYISLQGQACLDLGLLYKARNQREKAREYIERAVHSFTVCGATTFLEQAQKTLNSL